MRKRIKSLMRYDIPTSEYTDLMLFIGEKFKYHRNLFRPFTDDILVHMPNKQKIYQGKDSKGNERLIIPYWILRWWNKKVFKEDKPSWYQVCITKVGKDICKSFSGAQAFNILLGIIKDSYSSKEIEEIQEQYPYTVNRDLSTVHSNWNTMGQKNKIHRFTNCYYYDINSAYISILREVFPRCANKFNELYLQRKVKPENKKLFLLGVGMMQNKSEWRGIRHYIVGRIANILREFRNNHMGNKSKLIYANTDGLIIQNPVNPPEGSKELGELKLEYQGDVYTYNHSELGCIYTVGQYGENKKISGGIHKSTLDNLDLAKGIVVNYKNIDVKPHKDAIYDLKLQVNIETLNREIKKWR